MKKLLYLLLAITFIGCSSDDNSNEEPANQLFLDIYDGVVWQLQDQYPGEFGEKLTFYSDPSSVTSFYEDLDGLCETVIFGQSYAFYDDDEVIGEGTYTIQNEVQNSIVLLGQVIDNEGNLNPTTLTITATVSSGGNTLLLEKFVSSEGEQPDPKTYTIAPDEFPCN
jgi:hypothetical protein